MQNQLYNRKILLGVLAAILVAAVVYGAVELRDNPTAATRPSPNQQPATAESTPLPPNEVDYGPSDPSDNDDINEKKNHAGEQTPQTSTDLNATITNTRIAEGFAQISVLVKGATTGTCSITLSKDGSPAISKDSPIAVREGGLVGCSNFDIPASQLSKGDWKVSVIITSNNKKSAPGEGILSVQ